MRNSSKPDSTPPEAPEAGPEAAPEESAAAPGGVVAVTRALRLLEAFGMDEAYLSLAELSRRTGMHKTTTLRLARTQSYSSSG